MTKVINSFFLCDKSDKLHDKSDITTKKSDKSDIFPRLSTSVGCWARRSISIHFDIFSVIGQVQLSLSPWE